MPAGAGENVSVSDRVRIAVPDAASGERLRVALEGLDAELRDLPIRGLEVVVTLKSPDTDVVLSAVIETVEHWLAAEGLASTRVQVGDQPHTTVRLTTIPAEDSPPNG